MKLVWRSRGTIASSITGTSAAPSTTASDDNLNAGTKAAEAAAVASEAVAVAVLNEREKQPGQKTSTGFWSWKLSGKSKTADHSDTEKGSRKSARPIRLFGPVYGGLGAGLSLCELFVPF